MNIDIAHLRSWIGRTSEARDIVTPRLAASFLAVMDDPGEPQDGDAAPIGLHWCLMPAIVPMSRLGADGHPARGEFLPPVPLPRRMWAGGQLDFATPLCVGDSVVRHSRVEDVVLKDGRSGPLVFVTVSHVYRTPRGVAITERQDLVYRDAGAGVSINQTATARTAADAAPSPATPTLAAVVETGAALLFRYSAITFNGHRIHYDHPYVTGEEHYPGLVVHGPLQATYLLRLAQLQHRGALPARFTFRSVRPLVAGRPLRACATAAPEGVDLWVEDADGGVTMTASSTSSRAPDHPGLP
jgi:3-methylfumaryl-CoA hydratase